MTPLSGGNPLVDDFYPYFRVYKDGSVERLMAEERTPASLDPHTGVDSKDVRISADVSARVYLPLAASADASRGGRKLPLVLYFRGGAFCMLSSASPILHAHLNALAAAASALILSVDYRRAPEHRIPVPYDDSWAALEWAASHRAGVGRSSSSFSAILKIPTEFTIILKVLRVLLMSKRPLLFLVL